MKSQRIVHVLLVGLQLLSVPAQAEQIRIAAASNFTECIKTLAEHFQAKTGHKIVLSFGSTGKHYAQIKNGAPFDAYFAADTKRPELLEKTGTAVPGSRFTYAKGKLVLWAPKAGYIDKQGDLLSQRKFRYLAIANPKLAPYGKAAMEILQARGLWHEIQGQIVRGENIGQTFHFVKSANAELGFVALSQLKRPGQSIGGSYWLVPETLYTPIEQQAVLLTDNNAARAFMAYVRSNEAIQVIRDYGYGIP